MELSLGQQTNAFLWACVLGIVFGAVYTVIEIIKIASPPSKRLLFAVDVIFMLICGLSSFMLSVALVWGGLRFYMLFGEAVGFFLFYLIVGDIILKFAKNIISFFSKVYRVITKPFRILFHKIGRYLFLKTHNKSNKVKKISNYRQNHLKLTSNLLYNVLRHKHKDKKNSEVFR